MKWNRVFLKTEYEHLTLMGRINYCIQCSVCGKAWAKPQMDIDNKIADVVMRMMHMIKRSKR